MAKANGVSTHSRSWRLCFRETAAVLTASPSCAPQGENPIYKSAVTTVVNPKYEGK